MRECIEIGSSPAEEDCAQCGSPDYSVRARRECRAYIEQLYRFLDSKGFKRDELPETFSLVVKANSHDFGTYYEVACRFDPDDELQSNLASLVEGESPTRWDDAARKELNLPNDDDY